MKKQIAKYIYRVEGKRTVAFSIEIAGGARLGRFRSLGIAIRVRDEYLAKNPVRPMRLHGTGGISRTNRGKYKVSYRGRRLGTVNSEAECENLIRIAKILANARA